MGSTKVFRQLAEVRQRSAVGVESGSLLAVGMEVQEQMSAAFHRHPDELGCRYQQEFVRELPLFRYPRQRRDVRGWRWDERGLANRYPCLAIVGLGRHRSLDLQAAVTVGDPVAGQYLNHLQVWKGSEKVKRRIFREPADHLGLAKKSEPPSIAIDRRQNRFLH